MNITLAATTDTASIPINPGRNWRYVKGVRATLGPLEVQARSQAAARQALTDATVKLLDAFREPEFFTFCGDTVVISVSAMGGEPSFAYRIASLRYSPHHGSPTWDEAKRSGIRHMVQNACDFHDDLSVAAAADFTAKHLTADDVHDHLRYAAWQRAAKVAIAANEADYHRWASDHAKDFYAGVGLVE